MHEINKIFLEDELFFLLHHVDVIISMYLSRREAAHSEASGGNKGRNISKCGLCGFHPLTKPVPKNTLSSFLK